jgi:hypothetical protein
VVLEGEALRAIEKKSFGECNHIKTEIDQLGLDSFLMGVVCHP